MRRKRSGLSKFIAVGFVMCAAGASLGACATAQPISTPMPEGEAVTAPIGLMAFCRRHPEQCARRANLQQAAVQTVSLNERAWAELTSVNTAVNAAISPVADLDRYNRREYWTMPISLTGGAAGDCEDYALEKRQALIELGWPPEALRLAVADSNWTGPHTVLIAVTDSGDFVLDNLSDRVKPWSKTPYQWRKRQSGAADLDWRRIAAGPARMAAYRGEATGEAGP